MACPASAGILQAGNGQTLQKQQPGVDLARRLGGSSLYLVELALEIAAGALNGGEDALIKTLRGTGFQEPFGTRPPDSAKVKLVKSAALRARSTEMYLLAKDFRLV